MWRMLRTAPGIENAQEMGVVPWFSLTRWLRGLLPVFRRQSGTPHSARAHPPLPLRSQVLHRPSFVCRSFPVLVSSLCVGCVGSRNLPFCSQVSSRREARLSSCTRGHREPTPPHLHLGERTKSQTTGGAAGVWSTLCTWKGCALI